jgi:signal peptidase I
MQPGDLVKYKNGKVYLVNGKREIKGKVAYYFLDGFPANEVFSPEDLELINAAR